ncbi:Kv channel-interacting protein 1 isoform X1 [Eurytemora carolleeae]|uniref:Kv channel-interacting protein 1 isoform X1 n=1 Tax=Eurytemora carolleeae TaxID=1294199 RepID=UPI000C78AF15|nr:Kv channel-interacting protein 1 isoform X1 [Eurytemora carolleeae]|eukprot:XP_023330477.1 Kv channel-interacting protein 1-like isoform X1 [Eurytemora affinis]
MMKELSPDILAAVAQRLEDQSKRTFIDLEDLIRTTKFSKQEIRTMYRGFKQECPGGAVNEDTFREIYEKFFPYGNAACYAHHVFKAFDVNSTGAISFRDMLVSLSTLLHGTQYEKLKWTFRVYDLNGDGVITKTELGNVVVGIYELMGVNLLPPTGSVLNIDYIPRRRDSVSTEDKSWIPPLNLTISVRELRDNVETIFTRLDTNRDGVVTREEFVQSCLQDSTISSSLQNFQFKL